MISDPGCQRKPFPVLGFHHLDDDLEDYTSARTEFFTSLVSTLAQRYRFVPAGQAVDGPWPDEEREPLALTFDDGYRNIAGPLLRAAADLQLTATIYVITGSVGRPNTWNRKCSYWAQHLDVPELNELLAAGFELASHTRGHHNLTRLPDDVLALELRDSRSWLEDRFSIEVSGLAYPFGFHDHRVRQAARQTYGHAFTTTTKPGGTDLVRNRYELRRFMVTRTMSVPDVLSGIAAIWVDV